MSVSLSNISDLILVWKLNMLLAGTQNVDSW